MIAYVAIAIFAFATEFVSGMVDGKTEGFWDRGCVIYGEIVAVDASKSHEHTIHVTPLATLAGTFDSSAQSEIDLSVWISGPKQIDASMIEHVPKQGTKVLIFTVVKLPKGTSPSIPADPVMFMPGGRGLIEVTGFDDAKVTETLANLRKLRAEIKKKEQEQSR